MSKLRVYILLVLNALWIGCLFMVDCGIMWVYDLASRAHDRMEVRGDKAFAKHLELSERL